MDINLYLGDVGMKISLWKEAISRTPLLQIGTHCISLMLVFYRPYILEQTTAEDHTTILPFAVERKNSNKGEMTLTKIN